MTDWRTRLREADPATGAELPIADVRRIRSVVLAAAGQRHDAAGWTWSRPFVLVSAVLLVFCVSVLTALQQSQVRTPGPVDVKTMRNVDADAGPVERQQLQFATPGGTRIIWVFDSQFEVKGTLP